MARASVPVTTLGMPCEHHRLAGGPRIVVEHEQRGRPRGVQIATRPGMSYPGRVEAGDGVVPDTSRAETR